MFLRYIAKDLLQRYGNNLSAVTMVFPGKRARLFMNQYLAEESDKPVWAPNYITIDEMVQKLSPYRKAESITSVCTLYNVYSSVMDNPKTLDDFYAWGEVILSDFDDIDKHIAPADKFFQNAFDLQNISTDYLTEEQEAALREFFKNFSIDEMTKLKENFLQLWQVMPNLYNGLRQELKKQGLLYPGAQYRDVAERLTNELISPTNTLTESNDWMNGTICFAGFNILDESTEAIFNYFEKEHTTLFYWDYDRFYVDDTMCEAGLFMRRNLKSYPNALPVELFDNLRNIKDITYVATSTNNAQSRFIPEWIDQHLTERENETAIVLADEHQLSSVLHSIPESKPRLINVTMGFPLSDTPVFSFLSELIAMYVDGYDTTTGRYRFTFCEKVKRHPYFAYVDNSIFDPQPYEATSLLTRLIDTIDRISRHFAAKENPDIYDQLYIESLFKTHLVLTKFLQVMTEESAAPFGATTLRRLLRQVLSSTSIPFHGEPAIGMQVMGLLESRNIDFRHLLMMNVGEGILPKKSDDTSLIPYNLRESFGLTTMRHRVSVFAYYFFRLIQRCEHVTIMYNENAAGVVANEMSRFLRQLMAETDLPIKFVRLMPPNNVASAPQSNCVPKTDEMIAKLKAKYINNNDHSLSPTAINTLLKCSLQFYFKYIAGMRFENNPEDGITPSLFGNIFHDSADMFYRHLTRHKGTTTITRDMLDAVLLNKERDLYPFVDCSLIFNIFRPIADRQQKEQEIEKLVASDLINIRAYASEFFSKTENSMLLSGLNHIVHNVLLKYLTSLIEYDALHAPFTLVGLETDHFFSLELQEGQTIKTGGRIDRLELDKDDVLTVVDYKTGGSAREIQDVEAIFKHTAKHADYFLQTFIYTLAVLQEHPEKSCRPTLFYVNHCSKPSQFDRSMRFGTEKKSEPIKDIRAFAQDFEDRLRETLQNLFSKDHPFQETENKEACKYCDFRRLCNKQDPKKDDF